MHKPEQLKYPFALILEAFKRVVTIKHKYNKSLVEYTKHLKQGKRILEVHVGKCILGYYVENIDEFKNVIGSYDKKKIKSGEYNK